MSGRNVCLEQKYSFTSVFWPQYDVEKRFLEQFLDHKNDSLLSPVCVVYCVAVWETEATYTVGKA